ncbi:MAG: hypothetical protein V4510_05230 [bacterium]
MALLTVTVVLAPTGNAWILPTAADQPRVAPMDAAWTTRFSPPMGGGVPDLSGTVTNAVACAVGDLTGDGVADLVVQIKDQTGQLLRLRALAGPDFTRVVWTQVTSLQRILSCAPDIDLDGLADPVVRLIGPVTSAAEMGVGTAQQSSQQVLQVLSGATGLPVLGRLHMDSHSGAGSATGGAAIGAADDATSALLPAAAGAAAYVESTVKQFAVVPVPLPSLPVGALTTTAQASVHMLLLDAQGEVAATIDISDPATQVLAMAPIPLGGGLPDVAVLTKTVVSPVEQVAASVPKIVLYNVDGTVAWTQSLAATTGIPMILPRAGDLDLDGVPDLIVETVESGVQTAPAAAFQVLSGVDGHVVLASGAAVGGLLAVVPLGALPTGDALVQVKRVAGAATMEISMLQAVAGGATGAVGWTATIDAAAMPINAALDAYTQDVTGFTDLTGDGIPDVGVAVQTGADLAIQVLDGVTGKVSWNATVQAASSVVPIVLATAGPAVRMATNAAPTALLVIGSGTTPVMTLLDAASGQVQWAVTGVLSQATTPVDIAVQAAGDVDKDGVQDILATISQVPAVAASAGASVDVPTSIAVLSGKTGGTLYLNATDAARLGAATNLTLTPGPAYQGRSVPATASAEPAKSPAPVAALTVLLLAGLAGMRRRRTI